MAELYDAAEVADLLGLKLGGQQNEDYKFPARTHLRASLPNRQLAR